VGQTIAFGRLSFGGPQKTMACPTAQLLPAAAERLVEMDQRDQGRALKSDRSESSTVRYVSTPPVCRVRGATGGAQENQGCEAGGTGIHACVGFAVRVLDCHTGMNARATKLVVIERRAKGN
jgi:hypothetical protein